MLKSLLPGYGLVLILVQAAAMQDVGLLLPSDREALQQTVQRSSCAGNGSFTADVGSRLHNVQLELDFKVSTFHTSGNFTIGSSLLQGALLEPPPSFWPRSLRRATALVTHLQLKNVTIYTDCYTWSQYQNWYKTSVSDAALHLHNQVQDGICLRFMKVGAWEGQGVIVANLTLACEAPANTSMAGTFDISSDVQLYNALGVAQLLRVNSLYFQLDSNVSLSSCLWENAPAQVTKNLTLTGPGTVSSAPPITLDMYGRSGIFKLEAGTVHVTLKQLTLLGLSALQGGTAAVPTTGLQLVPTWMWAFEFPRSLSMSSVDQVTLQACTVLLTKSDYDQMAAWLALIMVQAGPIGGLSAPFRLGIKGLQTEEATDRLSFESFSGYGLNLIGSQLRIAPDGTLQHGPQNLVPLYHLELPAGLTVIPVYSPSDLHHALALLANPDFQQRMQDEFEAHAEVILESYSRPIHCAVVQLMVDVSLSALDWPAAGMAVTCPLLLQGVPHSSYETGLSIDLGLTNDTFLRVEGSGAVTFRWLTLVNAGSRSGTYSLVPSSKVTDSLTLPMWPVHFTRPASGTNASLSTALGSGTQRALLSFVSSRFVLPEEEYWALQAYAGLDARAYMGACMASTISSFTIGSSNEYGSVFKSLVATGWSAESLNVTHLSTVYPVALLRGSYALPSAPSPMPPQAKPGATVAAQTAAQAARQQSKGSGSNSTLVLAIAIPVGIAVLAAALVGVISNRRLQRAVLAVRSESHSHKVMAADNDATSSSGTRLPRVGPGSDQAPGHKEVAGSSDNEHSPANYNSPSHSVTESGMHALSALGKPHSAAAAAAAVPSTPQPYLELACLMQDMANDLKDKHLLVKSMLGRGGFAKVYLGTWRGLDVAVKVVDFRCASSGNDQLQTRTLTEAAICANVQHTNIVSTYSYDLRPAGQFAPELHLSMPKDGNSSWPGPFQYTGHVETWQLLLVQEYCDKGSLRQVLDSGSLHTGPGKPQLCSILQVAIDIATGLSHLHSRNIIHGDLTPSNVLLKADVARPGGLLAKLADFGLSVKVPDNEDTVFNRRTGTPFYASPEVRKDGSLSKSTDIYAFGVIMWELYAGRPCYQHVQVPLPAPLPSSPQGTEQAAVAGAVHVQGSSTAFVADPTFPSFPLSCPTLYIVMTQSCLQMESRARPQAQQLLQSLAFMLSACSAGLNTPVTTVLCNSSRVDPLNSSDCPSSTMQSSITIDTRSSAPGTTNALPSVPSLFSQPPAHGQAELLPWGQEQSQTQLQAWAGAGSGRAQAPGLQRQWRGTPTGAGAPTGRASLLSSSSTSGLDLEPMAQAAGEGLVGADAITAAGRAAGAAGTPLSDFAVVSVQKAGGRDQQHLLGSGHSCMHCDVSSPCCCATTSCQEGCHVTHTTPSACSVRGSHSSMGHSSSTNVCHPSAPSQTCHGLAAGLPRSVTSCAPRVLHGSVDAEAAAFLAKPQPGAGAGMELHADGQAPFFFTSSACSSAPLVTAAETLLSAEMSEAAWQQVR